MLGRGAFGKVNLGMHKLTRKLVVENCKTSKTAREAIEKAGGSIK